MTDRITRRRNRAGVKLCVHCGASLSATCRQCTAWIIGPTSTGSGSAARRAAATGSHCSSKTRRASTRPRSRGCEASSGSVSP